MTIAWFHEIGLEDLPLVGGKGANLGKMARAGLPVPPGFCVTTNAYEQFIRDMALWPEMEYWLETLPPLEAGEAIRRRIEHAHIPEAISTAIHAAYAQLDNGRTPGHPPVAVRSSATAEDLADASFAGQQETYLGIRGAETLARHVQHCWASLWTERAIAYRTRNQFPHAQVSLAVVVQEMIAPEVAGVLFTANPVTNNRKEMLANASYGLGESVVSGRVTPDTYRLGRQKTFAVVEQVCGTKATRIDMAPDNGTTETPVAEAERQRLCLNLDALRRLLELGMQVETHYGQPQDIEWGLANGQLYLLQTRPITSLASAPKPASQLNRMQQAIVNDLLEHYPEPPYPLDYLAVTDSYQQVVNAAHAYGMAMPLASEIIQLDADGLPTIHPPKARLSPRVLGLFGQLRKQLKRDPKTWITHQHPAFATELAALGKTNVAELDNPKLVQFIQSAVNVTSRTGAIRFEEAIIPTLVRAALLKGMLSLTRATKSISIMDLLVDLPYKTAVIDHALHQLAAEASKLPQTKTILLNTDTDAALAALEQNPEGRIFLAAVQIFLAEHGARTLKAYLPFSNRAWVESPAALLATVAVILRAPHPRPGPREPYPVLHQSVLTHLPSWLREPFAKLLEAYRAGHVARESTLYTIEEGFLHARRGVDEAAHRLKAAGALPQLEMVVYLTLAELYDALQAKVPPAEIATLARRRKQARPRAFQTWRGQWQAPNTNSKGAALKGLSGSAGMAAGPAKVITGPAEFGKLQPGDVLVCPYTDPAWTPLFTLACAVVSDTGGPLSHAAIVAREYGIPAVLGTQNATLVFKDGVHIQVDGQRGEVRLV